jgi:NAD(P)-dependent dehydrogenase (short-subunit alcohol dehydrogenase family)
VSEAWALVTGASRGIGRAITTRTAARGMRTILTARDRDALEVTRTALADAQRHLVVGADLTRDQEIDSLIDAVRDTTDSLDLLVLNAGIAISATIEETSVEEWDRCMQINLRAPFLLVKALLPLLRRARGTIIAIGSIVSTATYVKQGAYGASKHALLGLIKTLAKEVHPEVRVHSIQPGGVATDLVRSMRPDIDLDDLIQPDAVAATVESLLDLPASAVVDEIRLRRPGKQPWQQA